MMPFIDVLGAWIAIFITFCILSYLYDDNPFYKLAEHLFVGTSVGYSLVLQWFGTVKPNLVDRLTASELGAARFVYLVPCALVLCLFMKLTNRYNWMGRLAIAFVIGIYAGQNIPAYANSDLLTQIYVTTREVFTSGDKPLSDIIGIVVLVVGVVASLMYFFLSREHKGWFGRMSKVGIWVLMIGFGASFGYTVQGRISLAIGVAMDVLDISRPAAEARQVHGPVVSAISIAIIAVGLIWMRRRGTRTPPERDTHPPSN
ncbi:MAG: hypothetical protein HYY06_16845 [Deltaproteobacteria bacterium]|nr:hypothetical protein [Deltaproteobacteria bacterium]